MGQRTRPFSKRDLVPIGELAREFNVTLRTLRFYEAKGLLSPHRDGTARYYGKDDRAKLERILQGKRLGFTLEEVREIAAQPTKAGRNGLKLTSSQIRTQISHLERRRAEIDRQISDLEALIRL